MDIAESSRADTIGAMPMYHFRCETCGTTTERKMPFGSTELPACEKCGKSMVKVIVPPMVHFKGSGFYKTDSSSKPKVAEAPKPETPKKTEPSPKAP